MSEKKETSDGSHFGFDWRINVQTLIVVAMFFVGQAWYFSKQFADTAAKLEDHERQIVDFRLNGTPSVRVEIGNMKARLDAADGRLDRIERGVERVGDKLDSLINKK
jgi:hypothetical protein